MEPFSIENTDSLETVLYKMSTDIGLQNSKELSSLKTADVCDTISTVDSSGNAPKSTSTQPVHYFTSLRMMYVLVTIPAKLHYR